MIPKNAIIANLPFLISFTFIASMSFLPIPIGLNEPPGYAGLPVPPIPFSKPAKDCFVLKPGLAYSVNLLISTKFIMHTMTQNNAVGGAQKSYEPCAGMIPFLNQTTAVESGMKPFIVSGAVAPATPSIAHLPWITSAYANHPGLMKPPAPSGSDKPSGSKP
ncbi:unnamed protein product [Bathycoccus prasinos]